MLNINLKKIMMKNKIFCIPIETKVRELDGKLLLALNLLDKGFDIYLGARNGIFRELNYLENAIYLAKSISIENEHRYQKLKNNKNDIFVQNVEGGILYKDVSGHFRNSYPKELMHFVDGVFLYGDELEKKFIEYNSNFPRKNILVSGEPRFDLLKGNLKKYYEPSVIKLKEKYNNYILVNTSFSIANPFVGEKQLFDHMEKSDGYSKEVVDNLRYKNLYFKDVMNDFIDALGFLSKKYPKINFIIRPHPSESLDNYKEIFKEVKNISVLNKGNVHPWILASKGVLHYDCTTGIESVLASKPTISYVPKKDKNIFAWLPTFVSKEVNNLQELDLQINKIVSNSYGLHNLEEEKRIILNSFIANVTKNSSDLIAEFFKNFYSNKQIATIKKTHLKLLLQRFKSTLKYYKSILLNEKKKKISMRKYGDISKNEVEEKLRLLSKTNNKSFNFTINSYGKNVIHIKKK